MPGVENLFLNIKRRDNCSGEGRYLRRNRGAISRSKEGNAAREVKAAKEQRVSNRILYICSSWPHGPTFGGQLRALHVGRALQKVGQVTLAVVSSDVATPEIIKKTADEFDVEPPVRINVQPNRGLLKRVQWAFDPHFLNVHGIVANASDRNRLLNLLENFDLVWVLSSRTPNILNQWQWPRSVLDINDLPSTFQRTVWQNGANVKEKLKAGVQMHLSRRRE